MLNGCKARKLMLTALLLLVCVMVFTACGKKNNEVSSRRASESNESEESKKAEANKSNEVTLETSGAKVVISLKDGKLSVEQGSDKVQLGEDGIFVNGEKESVDVSGNGIHVKDGNDQVDIDASGIHVKDGLQGNTVDIDLSGLDINVDGPFGSFSLSDFLSGELPEIISDAQAEIGWNFFDDVTLLTKTVIADGNEKEIEIRLRDGYLVTKNCNEEDTEVNGLTLVRTETDPKGNVYRYYSE